MLSYWDSDKVQMDDKLLKENTSTTATTRLHF